MTPLGGKVRYRQWYKEIGGRDGMESLESLLEDCDVNKNGRHLGCHLGFLPRIRNQNYISSRQSLRNALNEKMNENFINVSLKKWLWGKVQLLIEDTN